MDEELVELISSDSGAPSPIYAFNSDHISGEIYSKSVKNIDKDLISIENETVIDIRTSPKQNRVVHVLSDSEDSDYSFSNKCKNNGSGESVIPYVLSDSEGSASNTSVKSILGSDKRFNKQNSKTFSTINALSRQEFDVLDDLVVDKPNVVEKKKQTRKRTKNNEQTKEERVQKKKEEEKKRKERQTALKLQKQLKPGECIKYMKVVLDSALLDCPFGGDLLAAVQNMDCEYQVHAQTIPFSITWQRHLPASNCIEEEQLLLVWQWEQFVQTVCEHSLCDVISSCQQTMPGKIITLIIYSIDGYFSYLKNKRKKRQSAKGYKERASDSLITLTRGEMDLALTELQIQLNCNHRFVNKSQELGLLVSQFTKSIAETPFKKEKQKREQDNLEWFATGDSRECVRVDKEGNGLLRLWQQQLCQFNLAGIDTAQAIAAVYPSPYVLIQAYDKCKTQKEGELLLQDIPVRRSHGHLAPARRIGPELSKKLYLFFNNVDGDCPLSQE